MAEVILKNVAPLALLERVTPELLLRFLRPYEAYLGAREVHLDGIAVTDTWLKKLHEVLQQLDPAMPPELQQALIDIGDLANEPALEQALKVSNRYQLDLFVRDSRVDVFDAPFRLYLDHRKAFDAAVVRLHATRVEHFVEYQPIRLAQMPAITDEHKERLRAAISSFFADRNRTAFCDLRAIDTEPEVIFVVIHGRAPKTHGVIQSSEQRSRLSYVADQHDVLVFDKRTGRLSVKAAYAVEKEFYRRTMGRVFFGTISHFTASMVMSGRPLVDQGVDALSHAGFPGIQQVVLQSVTFDEHDGYKGHVRYDAADMRYRFEQREFRDVLRRGEIVELKFRFSLEGRKKPVTVRLAPNDNSSYDRRVGAAIVRAFLLERGFIVQPEYTRPLPLSE